MKIAHNIINSPKYPHDAHEMSDTVSDVTELSINDHRLEDIMTDPLLDKIPEVERHEAAANTFELYIRSKEKLAPVVAGFASELLHDAGGGQVIFAARDGLGAYEAAKALLDKFPDSYEAKPDDLAYAYFTRKLMYNSDPHDLHSYISKTLGMDSEKPTLVADIGMYGSIEPELKKALPHSELRYMISVNPNIPGYIHDGQDKFLHALSRGISGNPAVHFLEDTFSGTTSSPSRLVRDTATGNMVPEMREGEDAYESAELMKRKYAAMAFGDYVSELDQPPSNNLDQDVKALDEFLQDPDQYRHLMVPHIR